MEKVYRATVRKPIALVAALSHRKDIAMTKEDKKRISEYMKWTYEPDRHCIVSEGENHRRIAHNLDLNDAGLCVKEMQKLGEYREFWSVAFRLNDGREDIFAWLFNAENFFAAMSQWLKVEGNV